MPSFPRMLGILLTLAAAVVPPASAQRFFDTTANAAKDVVAALEKARADKRLVLLDFGADWCPDCRALEKLFGDTLVAGFLAEKFHVVRIDVGRWNRNLEISKAYGSPIDSGIPAVVVLAPDGKIVA
jgi:thioredoxin